MCVGQGSGICFGLEGKVLGVFIQEQRSCSHAIAGVGRQAKPGFQPRYGFKTTMEAARSTGISGLGDCVACFFGFRV